jgi:hypothetical protein
MPPNLENLTPASSEALANSLAFALQFSGRKRAHNADGFMADIVAKRLVEHLRICGYVIMTGPPLGGHSQLSGPRPENSK